MDGTRDNGVQTTKTFPLQTNVDVRKRAWESIEVVWGEDVDVSQAKKILKKVDKCGSKLT